MALSASRQIAVECSTCGAPFSADVWLIVDSAERPDLWARCLEASIHVVTCPNGHPMLLQAPLLIHDAARSRLWFCPPGDVTTAEAVAVGRTFVARLYERATPDALDALPERVDLLAYRLLPLTLAGLPVPDSLAGDRERPGSDPLAAVLQEIVALADSADRPRCIQLCRDALSVVRRLDEEQMWAWLWLTLGISLTDNLQGDRAREIEEAIGAYEAALQVYTRAQFPEQWASIQLNLANAWSLRHEGGRRENIERALATQEDALAVYTRADHPTVWATLQNNLGNSYADRIAGDRADNIERAIAAYQRALEVRTRDDMPVDWAQSLDNLGHAYADRAALADRSPNLERAISAYLEALHVRTREALPREWAETQINLGTAYADLADGRGEYVDRAIQAYESASEVFTRDRAPERWAALQLNLASVYSHRTHGDPADNVEQAIRVGCSAFDVFTRDTSPIPWAALQNNLATLFREWTAGDPVQNRANAIFAYEAALEVYTPDRLPNDARRVARNLAQVHIELSDWDRAFDALSRAIDAAGHLYGSAITEEGRTVEIVENVNLYQQIIVVCLRLTPARWFDALRYAEEGRSRLFRDQLGTLAFAAPAGVPPALLQEEAALLRAARNCDEMLRGSHGTGDRQQWVDEAIRTRAALTALWDRLAREYGAPQYVALRRGETVTWEDIRGCLSATA